MNFVAAVVKIISVLPTVLPYSVDSGYLKVQGTMILT